MANSFAKLRLKFHAELNRKEERRLVILHGRRDSKEELKKAMSKLEGEKEELLFQQRRLESQKEGKNGY